MGCDKNLRPEKTQTPQPLDCKQSLMFYFSCSSECNLRLASGKVVTLLAEPFVSNERLCGNRVNF